MAWSLSGIVKFSSLAIVKISSLGIVEISCLAIHTVGCLLILPIVCPAYRKGCELSPPSIHCSAEAESTTEIST